MYVFALEKKLPKKTNMWHKLQSTGKKNGDNCVLVFHVVTLIPLFTVSKTHPLMSCNTAILQLIVLHYAFINLAPQDTIFFSLIQCTYTKARKRFSYDAQDAKGKKHYSEMVLKPFLQLEKHIKQVYKTGNMLVIWSKLTKYNNNNKKIYCTCTCIRKPTFLYTSDVQAILSCMPQR